MKDREETIRWTMQYCQHYDADNMFGIGVGGAKPTMCCKAGINTEETFDRGKQPCLSGNKRTTEEQLAICPHWLQRTREMGEQRFQELEDALNKHRIVGPVVAEWRKKEPIGKQETIECPVCQGELHLVQSSYNGHVHGNCQTDGCVRWME